MTDQPIESIELPETLTEQDLEDIEKLRGELPNVEYHPVLKVWSEILKPENREAGMGITPQWATAICGKYLQMTFDQMPVFHDLYFSLLEKCAAELADVIADDDDCLTYGSPEEDLQHNSGHYKELLCRWQFVLLAAELDWKPTSPTAAAEIAAVGEVFEFFFGQRGLTGHLEAIRLDFTDEDQENLRAQLEQFRAEYREGQ